jgi:hypothetical protein
MLVSKGRKNITFSWHDNAEISGRIIKKLLIERALLTEEEAYKLVHKIK